MQLAPKDCVLHLIAERKNTSRKISVTMSLSDSLRATKTASAPVTRLLQPIRKHLHGLREIRIINLSQLLQLAHTLRSFGSQQVALAGMHADQFAGAGNFEPLGGSAMSFQLHFRFRSIAWHCVKILVFSFESYES